MANIAPSIPIRSGTQPNASGITSLYTSSSGYAANGHPRGKIADFETLMNNGGHQAHIAFIKLCYIDFESWGGASSVGTVADADALFDHYQSRIDALQAAHRNVTIVHSTVPLYISGSSYTHNVRQHFNQRMRDTYRGLVFDLAAIESTDGNGNPVTNAAGFPVLAPEWSHTDGSHLNDAGSTRLAGALISFLAQVGSPTSQTGDLRVNPTSGTSYPANVLTILQNGAYTITMAPGVTTTTTDRIAVASGLTDVSITLNGVNINLGARTGDSDDNAAFLVGSRATVNLTLTAGSTSRLTSGANRAGLQVPSDGAKLTIGGTGTLEATATQGGGAGIGGNNSDTGGVITINSGTVRATGSGRGAGVGDGGGIGSLSLAAANKRRLLNYLRDQKRDRKIISGQMDTDHDQGTDMVNRVYQDTQRYPALKGFDFMQIPYTSDAFYRGGQQQIDEAINWWNGRNHNTLNMGNVIKPNTNGIVTFTWHWRMPRAAGNQDSWYTQNAGQPHWTNFRIPWRNNQLDKASADFARISADLERVAALLKQLQEKGIPVLWRPLHEARGHGWPPNWSGEQWDRAWMWWGASGPEPFKALWAHMYGLFNDHGLDNLIWVWNGQHPDYFPDPAMVDVVGMDIYFNEWPYYHPGDPNLTLYPNLANPGHSEFTDPYDRCRKRQYDHVLNMVPVAHRDRMIIALTENGYIPDPDHCLTDNAVWSWFMTWVYDYWSSDQHNTLNHRRHVYGHRDVITFDKLPDLTQYRLN